MPAMALFSCTPSLSSFTASLHLFTRRHAPPLLLMKRGVVLRTRMAGAETGGGAVAPDASAVEAAKVESLESVNGSAGVGEVPMFKDARWVGRTWGLTQFSKDGEIDWDAVIDAEVRRRKWLEKNPESTTNEEPVVFDTSFIPWWAWIKRFHLPETELLNGRAAMIGSFMA